MKGDKPLHRPKNSVTEWTYLKTNDTKLRHHRYQQVTAHGPGSLDTDLASSTDNTVFVQIQNCALLTVLDSYEIFHIICFGNYAGRVSQAAGLIFCSPLFLFFLCRRVKSVALFPILRWHIYIIKSMLTVNGNLLRYDLMLVKYMQWRS